MPAQKGIWQLARRQREAEAHDLAQPAETVHDEVARGSLRAAVGAGHAGFGSRRDCFGRRRHGSDGGRVTVRRHRLVHSLDAGAQVGDVGGHGAGGMAGEDVEYVVADHERLGRRHAHEICGVQDAVGRRFGAHAVVPCEHDVELAGREPREARQGTLHRGQAVAREDADFETERAEVVDEVLGALVGRAGHCRGELEASESGEGVVLPGPRRQCLDPLEHELIRRAADLVLDGREVELAGDGEGAVEVEEHGPQVEWAHGGPASSARHRGDAPALTWLRRP